MPTSFIADMRANGTLDDMYDRWVNKGETQMPPIKVDQSSPLHLKIGTSGTVPPYSYYIGSELAGYDIELGYRFAEWLGASVDLLCFRVSPAMAPLAAYNAKSPIDVE